MNPTPQQMKAARSLLGWNRVKLADRASVGSRTLQKLETGERVHEHTRTRVEKALVDAGVVWIGDGVKLVKQSSED